MSIRFRIDPKELVRCARRFREERKGNVAILTALILMMLVFGVGIGVDYTLARQKQSQIDGFADSAVLAAVSPNMMPQTTAVAQTTATNIFLSQLATMPNLSYSASNVSVNVVDTPIGLQNKRTATLTYTAQSKNLFAGVIGMQTLPVGGTSTSTSGLAPSINFYMLIDTSPSMEIAATTAGINQMIANTPNQCEIPSTGASAKPGQSGAVCGCAFGCHESDPAGENPALGNPGGEDNFQLARNLGITLRIDLVNQAVTSLMSTAPATAAQNHTNYQVALYTVDATFKTLQSLTSNFTAAQTAAGNISPLEVYYNNNLTKTNSNSDEDSYLDTALGDLNGIMPNPGNGTGNAGDTPQEVLFIVTDGVNDLGGSGGRQYGPIGTIGSSAWCTQIKARNIRIALLYLTYNPLPNDYWYTKYIAPFQSQIATDAQNCASPNLFFQVNTDGDVTAALNALFQEVVETAYLSK